MNRRKGDETNRSRTNNREPERYEIRVEGHLDAHWSVWFDGLTLRNENDGTTILQGSVADQSALHGVLQRIRNLGLELVSVNRINFDK